MHSESFCLQMLLHVLLVFKHTSNVLEHICIFVHFLSIVPFVSFQFFTICTVSVNHLNKSIIIYDLGFVSEKSGLSKERDECPITTTRWGTR